MTERRQGARGKEKRQISTVLQNHGNTDSSTLSRPRLGHHAMYSSNMIRDAWTICEQQMNHACTSLSETTDTKERRYLHLHLRLHDLVTPARSGRRTVNFARGVRLLKNPTSHLRCRCRCRCCRRRPLLRWLFVRLRPGYCHCRQIKS